MSIFPRYYNIAMKYWFSRFGFNGNGIRSFYHPFEEYLQNVQSQNENLFFLPPLKCYSISTLWLILPSMLLPALFSFTFPSSTENKKIQLEKCIPITYKSRHFLTSNYFSHILCVCGMCASFYHAYRVIERKRRQKYVIDVQWNK